jgi:hypothetical protein
MAIVTLGITGHRYLAEKNQIMAGVESAIQHILELIPKSSIRILSSLAEGADRILAKRLLMIPGTILWVPLPLPEEQYLQDFETSASKQEFHQLLGKAERVINLPAGNGRAAAYLAAGEYILENSDILLAVWDGKPAQSTGGTGEIIALARSRNLPLVWIHAGNRQPGTGDPTSLGPAQGNVTYENLPTTGRKE